MLVAVASHLKDDASLVAATHTCHLWRMALLSSPRLWSHLDFANEERALIFLERSKLAGSLSVDITGVESPSDIVRNSWKEITTKTTTLLAVHDFFLDELLAWPIPMLEVLEITKSNTILAREPVQYLPSLTSLVVHGFDPLQFNVPLLTSFHLSHNPVSSFPERGWIAESLLDFLRNCPLLEVAFLSCNILYAHTDSEEVVSLPLLRSFTHESYSAEYQPRLFDRLSLSSTCQVVLGINVTDYEYDPWIPGLPTPRDSSRLLDIRTVKIAAHSRASDDRDIPTAVFKIELANSTHGTTSFNRKLYPSENPSLFSYEGFLDMLKNIGMDSVETLCFDCYPLPYDGQPWVTPVLISKALCESRNLKTLILAECNIADHLRVLPPCPNVDTFVVSSWHSTGALYDAELQEFAESRKKAGSPLKALTLLCPLEEPGPSELERLTSCIGRVEVVKGHGALNWDIDKYVLAVTQDLSRAQSSQPPALIQF